MMFRLFPSTFLASARRLRVLSAVLLGLQGLLWGGGSILEARSAAESLSRYSHVEELGRTGCPPIHSHLDCLICRTWSGGASSGSATGAVDAVERRPEATPDGVLARNERGLIGSIGARGPPMASSATALT